ncbi:hypothetical protein N7462_003547 [Penicillium macrosclerotiorum]|uniref:uncharacterized protein n=1 Tax=Penicillium macrosclerotiorum TaxID=303699 RepID=UPI00254698EE|nr:uncharacterized protein N7462_003547 [Penicillium macrosclerotiorum]KAJ5689155.1 hypothetical protein N7462_003547 [Penicillium macrosclerotiorum]
MTKRSRTSSRSPSTEPELCARPTLPVTSTSSPPESSKILHLETEPVEVMHCSLPPHETLGFSSYEDYEVHYNQVHTNQCMQCLKNLPSQTLLDLHIEENHDALTEARRARGEKTYGCFIEDCAKKCSTPSKRRMHLIDKHGFPRDYNFYIVNDGIGKQTSLLRPSSTKNNQNRRRRISIASISSAHEGRLRRRSSVSQSSIPSAAGQVSQNTPNGSPLNESDDMEIDELERSMSALRFVPASLSRNRGPKAPPKQS